MKENILVSACLLGANCRFDGTSKPCDKVIKLNEKYNLIPVCPEVLGGLETPRTPCEIQNDRVISADGIDRTIEYTTGAQIALKIAKQNNCKSAILKSKSPSCGKGKIFDGTFSGTLTDGNGITAQLLSDYGIKVYNEISKNP